MCKLYIVSFCFFSPLSQGTYHRTIHCYNCSIPWYCQIWGTVVFFYSSVFFQYLFHLGFDLFDKHVEKVLLQHGLGTPYSNSACFDKDDIWTFCSFLYSACQLHYFPPPSPKIEFYTNCQRFIKTFHPNDHIFFCFWHGKYFIFNRGWQHSCDCKCILFQYCWLTCKNYLYL